MWDIGAWGVQKVPLTIMWRYTAVLSSEVPSTRLVSSFDPSDQFAPRWKDVWYIGRDKT